MSSTWRSFVPDYVVRTLVDHPDELPLAATERIDCVVLFADIAGFTTMSEALARVGRYGTEQLTGILNGYFGSMIDRVARYGGSVAKFAGDALTAVFVHDRRSRRTTARRAIRCALDMQAAMTGFQVVDTRAGRFGLAMRAGLAGGPVLATILGDPAIRLEYVLAGRALNRAVEAERYAGQGEVVADGELVDDDRLGVRVLDWRGDCRLVGGLTRQVRPRPLPAVAAVPTMRLVPFLHPDIADRLRAGRRGLVNEHRKVTVAFAGFPDLADGDPAAVARLQRFMTMAVRTIDRYGGYLRQVDTGDKGSLLVVLFGAPVSHEDDEERAVRCCLELLGLPDGAVAAGVTTGYAYCGEVGSDTRREYAAIGHSVNLAVRLLQAARPGQLLIDAPTHERVAETAIQDHLEPVTVKGKTGTIDVWAVRAVHDRAEPRARALGSVGVVGRAAEVAVARSLVERALAGDGQLLGLTGAAGIGKSRLVAEAVRIATGLGFAAYGGACRSHGTATSYLVWRSIWRGLLELDPTLPIPAQQAQLTGWVARRDGGWPQRAPLLAPVVNLPMPDSELTASLDPQLRDELLRSLLLGCLRGRARAGPLVLVLEDCQWIDPASLILLEFLARNVADLPVLVVAAARSSARDPSRLAALTRLPHFTELVVAELPAHDAERLVGRQLRRRYGPGAALAPEIVRRIAARGDGNPFYLEELVSFLHATGVDPHDAHAFASLDLPDNLHRVVMARIDQLSEGEKATIKVASVIGRRFRAGWISGGYPAAGRPHEIARHLEHLGQLDLTVRKVAGPDPEYGFTHAIIQEVAYQSLTFHMRALLHERVGEFLESAYPDRLAQFVDVLAYHYGRTRRVDKQRVWFRAAGDAAKAAFANQAAVEYYQRLLPLLPERERGEVLVELGGVWQHTGRWAEAEQAFRRAMRVAEASGDRAVLAASQRELGGLFMYTHSYQEAARWLRLAVAEFERLGDRQGLSRALDRLTYTLINQSAYDQALAVAGRQLAIARAAGDLAGVGAALNHQGLVRWNTGQTGRALALLGEALDVATGAGDRRGLTRAASNLASVQFTRGDHAAAVASWLRALATAEEIGYRQIGAVVIGNLGEVYLLQGDHARATSCFAHAFAVAAELGDWTSMANRMASLATATAAQGRDGEALQLFARATALTRMLDAPFYLCYCLHHQARLHAGRGRLGQAERLNAEALEVAGRCNHREVGAQAGLLALRLEVALGRTSSEEAVRQLRALEPSWTEPDQHAALLDTIWQLDPTQERARRAAAELYRSLHELVPVLEYRDAYERLTGQRLARPGQPLPPLPQGVGDAAVDVEALLRQTDLAAGQLGAA
jgi:class 3 adenylate cyclase/tetratricopeptide (TPR) repeat protein